MGVVLEIAVKELETKIEEKNENIRTLEAKNKILEEEVAKLQRELSYANGKKDAFREVIERAMEMREWEK